MYKHGMMKWETLAIHMSMSATHIVLLDALAPFAHTTLRYALCELHWLFQIKLTATAGEQTSMCLVLLNVII